MSSTRLAAIMFTDIVGYTAMMQENRQEAMASIRKFEDVLQIKLQQHRGELLQTYGDGSLSIFDSASAALLCAMDIQEEIREQVPLRIGIHLGEITIEGQHTFGDGVNIASRIESMGVAGAVLVSRSIYQQVKNNPQFELESLGKFAFKNVADTLEVFGLNNEGFDLPKKSEMKGKGKALKAPSSKSRIWFISIGILAIILGIGLIWGLFFRQTEKLEEIKALRIAILPFENKTNNPDFDVLGDMASDHVIQGMMNLEDVKVVSYSTIRENLENTGTESESFAQRTGAQKLIRGNIYKEGDSLVIKSQIIDLKSNEFDMALPEIRSAYDQPRKLVSELRSRILGFFVTEQDQLAFHSGSVAPHLKAFQAYQKALEFFHIDYDKSREYLEESIRIDSSYFYSHQVYFYSWFNTSKFRKADSIFTLMKMRFPNPDEYQQLYLDFNEKVLAGNFHNALPEAQAIFKRDPKNLQSAVLLGQMCTYLNLPQECIDVISNIQIERYPTILFGYTSLHGIYAFQLIRKDRDKEAREVLNLVPMDNYHFVTINTRSLYHAKQGDADSIKYFLNELEKYDHSPFILSWVKNCAANYLAIYGDTLGQVELAETVIGDFQSGKLQDSVLLFDALMLARQYDKALELGEILVTNGRNPNWRMGKMGWIHAQAGRQLKARQLLDQLIEQFPEAHYQRALIHTALGENAEAMESLVRAFDSGTQYYTNYTYNFEFMLLPLREYQPFIKKFVEPEG